MQNLTPIDIQKQTFSRKFRGADEGEVRAYLHLVAEELENHLQDIERLTREVSELRSDLKEYAERERILKDTLLSAQKVSEDVKANAHKEAALIVKDAELLSERIVGQAMERVSDLEGAIQDLKLERKNARRRLQLMIDGFQHMIALDADQEAEELPITQLYRKRQDGLGTPRPPRTKSFTNRIPAGRDRRSWFRNAPDHVDPGRGRDRS